LIGVLGVEVVARLRDDDRVRRAVEAGRDAIRFVRAEHAAPALLRIAGVAAWLETRLVERSLTLTGRIDVDDGRRGARNPDVRRNDAVRLVSLQQLRLRQWARRAKHPLNLLIVGGPHHRRHVGARSLGGLKQVYSEAQRNLLDLVRQRLLFAKR